MAPDFKLDQYEPVSKHGAALTEGLMRIWEKLGRPEDTSTESGWTMLDQVVNCWTLYFPREVNDWIHDRDLDLQGEITLQQLVKKDGGYNPITYPPIFFQLVKAVLPKIKLTDKKFQRKLSIRHPLFKTTNLKL